MATAQGRRVTVTIPEDAPPGTVLNIPVKESAPLQIRVPDGLGPGSKVRLTKLGPDSNWDMEVDTVVPPPQPLEEQSMEGLSPSGLSQEQLAALWEQQQSQQLEEQPTQPLVEASSSGATRFFRPAAQFEGAVPNCVFKLGELGLGYYLDEPPAVLRDQERDSERRRQNEAREINDMERDSDRRRQDEVQELNDMELQQLQQQQLRLQQQRRDEEMQRQRLLEQEQRPGQQGGLPSNQPPPENISATRKAANEAGPVVFEPEAPRTGSAVEIAYTVRLDTTAGIIDIIVRPDWAPHGVRRFMDMVASGELDDLYFYRAIEGCIAQFGLPVRRKWDPIPDDVPCGVPFLHGAVCFAALGENSRKSTIFICTGDVSHCLGQKPWETVIGAIAENSLPNLERINTSYGDILEFGGNGPDTGRIASEGNDYLRTNFPKLTHIRKAWPLDWEPDNPQDDLSAPKAASIEASSVPPDRKEHVAIAAGAARDAQDEAARAARLAATATTPAEADAAAEAARNCALFAQQAQAAAAKAQAQVEAARSRMAQQPARAHSASATPTKRPVVTRRSTPPPQENSSNIGATANPLISSRSITPVPQRTARPSSTPPQVHTSGNHAVPNIVSTYACLTPQGSTNFPPGANFPAVCQVNRPSYTPPQQAALSYTPMPRKMSFTPGAQQASYTPTVASYTPAVGGNSGALDSSAVMLNATAMQLDGSPPKMQWQPILPMSTSVLPGRPDAPIGTPTGGGPSRQQSLQQSLNHLPQSPLQPMLPWSPPAQSQWLASAVQPSLTTAQVLQQMPWVQQSQQLPQHVQQLPQASPLPHQTPNQRTGRDSFRFSNNNMKSTSGVPAIAQACGLPQSALLGGMVQQPMHKAIGH